MIAIIDYQMGNLRSVEKAFLKVGARVIVTSSKSRIIKAKKVVLPGVGAFGDGMKELRKFGLVKIVKEAITDGKPFFGICLGMQLLFEKSEEAKGISGLGVLKGAVKKFRLKQPLKVPHMGWNQLKGVSGKPYVYFVHSYYCDPKDKSIITAKTDYGIEFASMVNKDNIYGCQFHPEKSQDVGLRILEKFVKI